MSTMENNRRGRRYRRRSANLGTMELVQNSTRIPSTSTSLPENGVNHPSPHGQAVQMTGVQQGISSVGNSSLSSSNVTPHSTHSGLTESSVAGSSSMFQHNSLQTPGDISTNQNHHNIWRPVNDYGRMRSRMEQGLELNIPPVRLENGSNSFPLTRAEENGGPFLPTIPSLSDPSSFRQEEELLDMVSQVDNNIFNLQQMRTTMELDEELNNLQEHIRMINFLLIPEVILEGLDLRKYSSNELEANGEQERCCVCLDELVNEQYLVKLDCNHHYHFNCINQWLQEKNQCPICRKTAIPLD